MNTDHNMSEQSGQSEQSGTQKQSTTMERMEKNKYKIPILSDRETDSTKTNPRMWWEQISKYIDLTYDKNLEYLMIHGTEGMGAHTIYHLEGDVIWALGPISKYEIMRGQWGRELKDVNIQEFIQVIQKDVHARPKCIPQQSTIL